MGHEMVDGFQETHERTSGCATDEEILDKSCESNDLSDSETVITIPKELSKSNISCQTSSVETTAATDAVVIDSGKQLQNSGENAKVSEKENEGRSWVVDVKCGDEEVLDGERVCRICHLSYEQASKASSGAKTELIRLGCGCNGELSIVHPCCAEAWFKLKGNRICEICGKTVKNIRRVGNDTFMEEWVNSGGVNGESPNSSERNQQRCWHGQPLCNFLMACLVIAFVVPWFFHINMF